MNYKFTFLVILALIGFRTSAQQTPDIAFVSEISVVQKTHTHYEVAKNNKNEIQQIFSLLFLGYKQFFSSQDNNRCSFEPSCSVYAMQSLKKHGMLIGVMDACDRLLRCNGLNPDRYDYNEETGLLIDKP